MEGEKFHRERYISSGSGFALIASLELRFLEFRRASAIVSAPPELHPTPHRAGWTRGYISERVLFRGEIHARVLSHGMLDRSKPLFSPRCSFTPSLSSFRACISTLLREKGRKRRGGRLLVKLVTILEPVFEEEMSMRRYKGEEG